MLNRRITPKNTIIFVLLYYIYIQTVAGKGIFLRAPQHGKSITHMPACKAALDVWQFLSIQSGLQPVLTFRSRKSVQEYEKQVRSAFLVEKVPAATSDPFNNEYAPRLPPTQVMIHRGNHHFYRMRVFLLT